MGYESRALTRTSTTICEWRCTVAKQRERGGFGEGRAELEERLGGVLLLGSCYLCVFSVCIIRYFRLSQQTACPRANRRHPFSLLGILFTVFFCTGTLQIGNKWALTFYLCAFGYRNSENDMTDDRTLRSKNRICSFVFGIFLLKYRTFG